MIFVVAFCSISFCRNQSEPWRLLRDFHVWHLKHNFILKAEGLEAFSETKCNQCITSHFFNDNVLAPLKLGSFKKSF